MDMGVAQNIRGDQEGGRDMLAGPHKGRVEGGMVREGRVQTLITSVEKSLMRRMK